MLEQSFLEALRGVYWPFYMVALAIAGSAFIRGGPLPLGRALLGMMFASVAQATWEGFGAPLTWWQHIAIDLPLFALITMPPRHYWQAAMGALVFAQLILHCVWAIQPDLARLHWLGCILLGFAKCAVLILWSGGARVQATLDRVSRAASRMVLAASYRGHA